MYETQRRDTVEHELRAEAKKVERILDDLQGMVGPSAWQRVEELLQTVTGLYAAGLERALQHARESGADARTLDARLCDDALAASLLLLHGLHPRPLQDRIEHALATARTRFGHRFEIVQVDDGALTLRASNLPACPSSRAALMEALADLLAENAPEVLHLRLADDSDPAARLVQIDVRRADRSRT